MADSDKTPVQEAAEDMGAGDALWRRWIGSWLDFIAVALLVVLPVIAVDAIPGLTEEIKRYAVWPACILGLLYFPVLEGFWGRSLGKLVSGLKIVDKNGRVPGLGRAVVRTLFRLVEVNPFLVGGVPAGIVLLCSKRKQRLGDMVAGTYVLSADRLRQMVMVDATLKELRETLS
ncbi:MAG: RDD family protein [Alphaproteobacteria bacterium]|nr:RDD family protein [Alphaproteobacteria bacterium]